jgi:hypothetical protein
MNVLEKVFQSRRIYSVLALCAASAVNLSAQTFTLIRSFNGGDGAYPAAPLVQSPNGYLYGTTIGGGSMGGGSVFGYQSGDLNTIYSFCSLSSCTDGSAPSAGLIQAANGISSGQPQWAGRTVSPAEAAERFFNSPRKACSRRYTVSANSAVVATALRLCRAWFNPGARSTEQRLLAALKTPGPSLDLPPAARWSRYTASARKVPAPTAAHPLLDLCTTSTATSMERLRLVAPTVLERSSKSLQDSH